MAFHGGPCPANLAAGALGGRRELRPVLRRRPCVVAGMAPAGRSIRPFGSYSRPSIHEPHGHGRSPCGIPGAPPDGLYGLGTMANGESVREPEWRAEVLACETC